VRRLRRAAPRAVADGRSGAASADHASPPPPPPPSLPASTVGANNKGEAGSVRNWARELWARGEEHIAKGRHFGLSAPAPGEAPSVRWSLYESDASLNQSLISEGTTISQARVVVCARLRGAAWLRRDPICCLTPL
jgi:hypothetical protein